MPVTRACTMVVAGLIAMGMSTGCACFLCLSEAAAPEIVTFIAPSVFANVGQRLFIHGELVLTTNRYDAARPDAPIQVFEAGGGSRQDIELVLAHHEILARFHIVGGRVKSGDSTALIQRRLGLAAARTRELGGDGLLVTRHSEIVAVVMQNDRYRGPPGEVFYALRHIDRSDTR